jgi:hypothetical protein
VNGFDLILIVLASPILVLRALVRACRTLRHKRKLWSLAYRARVPCDTCGASISLVGLWKCGCGFTYQGHVLRTCPVCEATPAMVRCFACGVTAKLPDP